MCRLLGYIGSPVSLEKLLYQPEHSLIVQSYKPQEMNSGVVNADGFGIGWYHHNQDTEPFTYKNTFPIWNDVNLPSLSRYIESSCILAYVRSATAGQALDFSNCQPFGYEDLLFTHNGCITNFRQTLYRPIRQEFNDEIYQLINGTTDSEHMFGLLLHHYQASPDKGLQPALQVTLLELNQLAKLYQTEVSANIVISDRNNLIASRFATSSPAPTLYWLEDKEAVIMGSEPLYEGNWQSCPENSIISVSQDLNVVIEQI